MIRFEIPFEQELWDQADSAANGELRNRTKTSLIQRGVAKLKSRSERHPSNERPRELTPKEVFILHYWPKVERGVKRGSLGKFLEGYLSREQRQEFSTKLNRLAIQYRESRLALVTALRKRIAAVRNERTQVPKYRNPLVKEFLEKNEWIDDEIREGLRQGMSTEDVMAELERDFPNYLKPYEQTPGRKDLEESNVIAQLLQRANNHEEQYPDLRSLMEFYRTGKMRGVEAKSADIQTDILPKAAGMDQ